MVSQHAGVHALLVHALHDRAKQFYEHYGFPASPVHPLPLLLRLQQFAIPMKSAHSSCPFTLKEIYRGTKQQSGSAIA